MAKKTYEDEYTKTGYSGTGYTNSAKDGYAGNYGGYKGGHAPTPTGTPAGTAYASGTRTMNVPTAGGTGNKNGGGNGGGGSGAGTVAPSVQAAASGSAGYNPYTYDPVTGKVLERPESEIYSPSQDVLDAQAAMKAAQQGRPGAYTPSAEVIAAQQALEALQTTKPQGYTSKYAPQMEALLEQIQNPGKFNYEFNGDNLFKMYADEYTRRGKQASMDAMGQAAALTGGYGNSYAQMVGQQAYDQNLTELYDRGLELRDRAYEEWLNEQQNKYNQYGLLNDADQTGYGRYRDEVGDWENERNWLGNRYDTERNVDYSRYRDTVGDWENNRDYATNRYDTERSVDYGMYGDRRDMAEKQYQFDASTNENIRQFNESLNWDIMNAQQKYAADYAMNILANGQMPSTNMLKAAGLSEEDAQKLKAQLAASGGGGRTKNNTFYVDKYGVIYGVDKNGNEYYPDTSAWTDDGYYIDKSKASEASKGSTNAINTAGLISANAINLGATEAEKKKKNSSK